MPQKRASAEPPPVMTWKKAFPVLVIALIFDAVRLMFEMFWFFGPALTAAYCTFKVSGALGTTLGGFLCSGAAAAAGFFGFAALATFGTIMAIAVGLFGWMVLGFILIWTNARVFKENPTNTLMFIAGLGIAEIPFLGALPSFTLATWRMYHSQIKKERVALIRYEKERADEQAREQNKQAAQLMQMGAELQNQEAANDEFYAETANDEVFKEIPEEVRRRA